MNQDQDRLDFYILQKYFPYYMMNHHIFYGDNGSIERKSIQGILTHIVVNQFPAGRGKVEGLEIQAALIESDEYEEGKQPRSPT